MNFFPMKKPALALSVSEEDLCLVSMSTTWRKRTLEHVNRIPLPSGVIRLSSAKPNILEPDIFLDHLQTLVASVPKPISLAICLPDLCARTSVFEFSTFPTKTREQTALVSWRFQQDLKLDTSHSRLSYGVFVPTTITRTDPSSNPEVVSILGTAIRNEVIEQYETACLQSQLIPLSVGLAGLHIFNYYHQDIQRMLETESRRGALSSSSGAMFLYLSRWGLTFLAFQDGCPRFIRTKAIAIQEESLSEEKTEFAMSPSSALTNAGEKPDAQNEGAMESSNEGSTENDHRACPYPSYTVMKVEKEILATLQYYVEMLPDHEDFVSPSNLFVATDMEHGASLLPPDPQIEHILKASGKEGIHVHISQLSDITDLKHQAKPQESDQLIWSALPGFASLRVA